MARISLNSDLGEGYGAYRMGEDDALLALVTDANIACGFHGGDPDIMDATCRTAAANGVGIGAHPGFRDLIGFGRRFVEVSRTTLANELLYQLGALTPFARRAGSSVNYVKVHGALYHAAVQDNEYADAVLDAILAYDPQLPFLCQPGTSFAQRADDRGVRRVREGYIDRGYQRDGLLVPRSAPGAVITDVNAAADRAVRLATEGTVETADGDTIDMPVDSLCIHSDSPGAPEMARGPRRACRGRGRADVDLNHGGNLAMTPPSTRRVGEDALLVELASILDVHALALQVRDHPLASELVEVVPAQRTVMVMGPMAVVQRVVADVTAAYAPPESDERPNSRTIELSVRYDGEDLDELARRLHLTTDEIIAAHTDASYSVDFFGFAPGLAYFSGVPSVLRVPRRPSPRTQVPAGSVAIANDYTVIYPAPTPGGWSLIGTLTGEALWQTDREPPNRVDVGDTVVFRAV
ncbi:5-oxoprolinase subunit PxpA [Epidermidibacterium keratini]|uniref:5-oxoprolinase subunit PxpA n=1 Tax=Epidermidibacterium keratini TaxID=1891644 RepID=A0A7L4YHS5_9ACTN|nr:5-oxoprolinase subunit PxpA [Epidermidibacterium keratini]QHB98871.1 5-oxoprolinase subunit PxpA [Epidermidibacterium keratini]